ncbi:hypothetical protein OQA88_11220 [Cercophora sp. LCS_1]
METLARLAEGDISSLSVVSPSIGSSAPTVMKEVTRPPPVRALARDVARLVEAGDEESAVGMLVEDFKGWEGWAASCGGAEPQGRGRGVEERKGLVEAVLGGDLVGRAWGVYTRDGFGGLRGIDDSEGKVHCIDGEEDVVEDVGDGDGGRSDRNERSADERSVDERSGGWHWNEEEAMAERREDKGKQKEEGIFSDEAAIQEDQGQSWRHGYDFARTRVESVSSTEDGEDDIPDEFGKLASEIVIPSGRAPDNRDTLSSAQLSSGQRSPRSPPFRPFWSPEPFLGSANAVRLDPPGSFPLSDDADENWWKKSS